MAIFIPSYWASYGPTNFLYFCDVALFVTLIALWRESAALASAAAVGILIPQILWAVDFGLRVIDLAPTGMTAYMFDSNIAAFYRGLSFFHGWLPFLLIYMVWRLGYDKLGLLIWTITAEILLLISYFFLPAPPGPLRIAGQTNPPVNVNYVYGLSDAAPQTWMPETAWLAVLMIGLPILIYWPTHRVLKKWRSSTA
ncbi:MAG: hypothetical protein AAF387_16230 [Pseudomonadota bacterium]